MTAFLQILIPTSLVYAFLIPLGTAEAAVISCKAASTSEDSIRPFNIEIPPIAGKLRQAILEKQVDSNSTYFVLLPGNMGKAWERTNHNVGFELLADLIKHYRASDLRKDENGNLVSVEVKTFNTKDFGDDTDFMDSQEFFSVDGYSRNDSGEIFVSQLDNGTTLVFMRRVGFYNDVGDFFIPTIQHIGGKVENIIAIHDELNAPLGDIQPNFGNATYDGNRAILSIHNNLNAYRLDRKLQETWPDIANDVFKGLPQDAEALGKLFQDLRRKSWETVLTVKDRADYQQFASAIFKQFSKPLETYLKALQSDLAAEVAPALKTLQELKSQIAQAEDRKAAGLAFRELKDKMIDESPSLTIHFAIDSLIKDVASKRSETIAKIVEGYAKDFDPRTMEEPFSSLGIGTGYRQWVDKALATQSSEISGGSDRVGHILPFMPSDGYPPFEPIGFPPLPIGIEEVGGRSHFVLSPRDPIFDDPGFPGRVIELLDQFVGN